MAALAGVGLGWVGWIGWEVRAVLWLVDGEECCQKLDGFWEVSVAVLVPPAGWVGKARCA